MEPHMEESSDDKLQEEHKGPPVETVFNTPSDYRQMALDIKRELEQEEGSGSLDDRDGDEQGVSTYVFYLSQVP